MYYKYYVVFHWNADDINILICGECSFINKLLITPHLNYHGDSFELIFK